MLDVIVHRQTQTLVFTDVVRSTKLLRGPAGNRAMAAHLSSLGELVTGHHGHLMKTLGDGVMAMFTSAQDAIRCAVAMQCATAQRQNGGPRISIRIGISTGDVEVSATDCFGTTVVESSRLCDLAHAGEVLVAESTRLVASCDVPMERVGPRSLKGLADPTVVWKVPWTANGVAPLSVVLADDAVLVREGIARVLEAAGIDVLGQVGDAAGLLRLTHECDPDVVIVDIRMPPTHTDEGVVAAERILRDTRSRVLILSQTLEPRYAARLLAASQIGVGYLLKERVADVRTFVDATRRVAGGGQAFEPAVLSFGGTTR